MKLSFLAIIPLITFSQTACADQATLEYGADFGPKPILVSPVKSIIPTVKIAKIIGWKDGQMPVAHEGFKVNLFAEGLKHPRNIYVLPNGDVLVAETDAPPKPDDAKGIKGFFMKLAMKKAGSGKGSANQITLLRDTDGDGHADMQKEFITGLNSPYGMALVGDYFYVANTDSVVRFKYEKGATSLLNKGEKIVDLPGGTINHHWTKSLVADPDGKHLYVAVGSNSNVGENGIDKEENRAAILKVDIAAKTFTVFASGLRNPNGLAWEKHSKTLWAAVNERDELGSDLVPDYMTSVKQGAFYGWPYSYYGQHVDDRVSPQKPDLVKAALKPDYALGAHTASLGLAFYNGNAFGKNETVALIGQHGSWNREPPSGYKVIYVPFKNGKPNGKPHDLLTGFLNDNGDAMGRPVDVDVDQSGAILIADDAGNKIWRVSHK